MDQFTIPNILTTLRILLVPVFVVAILGETDRGDVVAAFVFWLASVTDWFDGRLARSRNQVTSFGKLMDPIADKLLVIAALVSLVSLDRLAAWVAMVIIGRELFVTVLRMGAAQQGAVQSSQELGRIKTVVQVTVIFALIAVPDGGVLLDAAVYGMVVLTIISGLDAVLAVKRSMEGEADSGRQATRAPSCDG